MNCTNYSDAFYYARREYCYAVFYASKENNRVSIVGCYDGMPMYYDHYVTR